MLGLTSSNKGIIGIIWYNAYRAAPGIVIAFVMIGVPWGVREISSPSPGALWA